MEDLLLQLVHLVGGKLEGNFLPGDGEVRDDLIQHVLVVLQPFPLIWLDLVLLHVCHTSKIERKAIYSNSNFEPVSLYHDNSIMILVACAVLCCAVLELHFGQQTHILKAQHEEGVNLLQIREVPDPCRLQLKQQQHRRHSVKRKMKQKIHCEASALVRLAWRAFQVAFG